MIVSKGCSNCGQDVEFELDERFTAGALMIVEERTRQIDVEKYSPHADYVHYSDDELTNAAISFAMHAIGGGVLCQDWYPPTWDDKHSPVSKSHKPLKDLVIAGALIAAEIDRRLRAGETL